MKPILLFCLLLCCCSLFAADPLQMEESVFIYTDGLSDGAFKEMKNQFKDPLNANKIEWKVKKGKASGFMELAEQIDKELLRADASRYVLALGLYDLWDVKEKAATTTELADFKTAVETVVRSLKEKGKKVIICTPYQIWEGTEAAANERIGAAAEMLRELATAEEVACCDLYQAFEKAIARQEPAKRGKGITTKDGIKINDEGEKIIMLTVGKALSLAGPTLTRQLAKGDVIELAAPFRLAKPMEELSMTLKEHFREEMSVSAPRAVDINYGLQMFNDDPARQIADFKKAQPTILIVYPGASILGDKKYRATLDDGTFKEKLKQMIETVRVEMDVELFICTPLIWCEDPDPQKVVVGGEYFKVCQQWADQTRAVAEAHGVPIVDLHQLCLDHIEEHGAEAMIFAGQVKRAQNMWYDMDYKAKDLVREAIAKVIHFDYEKAAK